VRTELGGLRVPRRVQQVWHAAVTDRVAFLEPAIFEQLVQLR